MPKVYVSPSTQENNRGTSDYGTEEYRMNIIADHLVPMLAANGIQVKRNRPEMTLNQVVVDSNKWKPDIHVAIHSNAGGGEGTEVFHYSGSSNGQKLAECLYKEVSPLSPGKDRGVKPNRSFYELARTIAPAALIEVGFHDNKVDSEWIIRDARAIAQAHCRGICSYFGIKPKGTDPDLKKLMLENAKLRAENEKMRQVLKAVCGLVAPFEIY